MKNNDIILSNKEYWDQEWPRIFDHYQQDIRHAYYIRALKRNNEKKLLEIAAGSFRDMAALNSWGISCDGIDYSTESIERAKLHFPTLKDRIHKMNAFKMDFEDKSFDLTFHNGFWGCFSDEEILELAKEQARISKYRMIATVHNAHNISFKQYFDKMKETDPLYSLRFFLVDEIVELMSSVCQKVIVVPVGKGKKYHEDRLINEGKASRSELNIFFRQTGMKYINISERLLCIGTV
jgi:hypothetical protein